MGRDSRTLLARACFEWVPGHANEDATPYLPVIKADIGQHEHLFVWHLVYLSSGTWNSDATCPILYFSIYMVYNAAVRYRRIEIS